MYFVSKIAWTLCISGLTCGSCPFQAISVVVLILESMLSFMHVHVVLIVGTEFIGLPEHVSDLRVAIDKDLGFIYDINRITCKAHHRVNLIHRCFLSKNTDFNKSLRNLRHGYEGFYFYARPILGCNSPVRSPALKRDINSVESGKRRFTKVLPGLSAMNYHSRLKN